MHATAEIQVIPIGAGVSVREEVRRAHEIINAYTLGFFDQYLKGKPSDLLSGAAPPYAEAKLGAWQK